MQRIILAPVLLALSVILAGCATNESTPTPATGTQPTTTTQPTGMMPGTGGMSGSMQGPCPHTMGGMHGVMGSGSMMGQHAAHHGNASPNATELVFTLSEPTTSNPCYSLTGPATSPSGWINVTLRNLGSEAHQAALIRMNMSADSFAQMMHGNLSAHNWTTMSPMLMHPRATHYGGPLAEPGGNDTVRVFLDPGEYAVVCWMPNATGAPHAMAGMMTHLSVTNATTNLTEPTPDLTIRLTDYAFNLSANLTPGPHVVRVVNDGARQHEAALVKLVGNATAADLLAAYEPNATAPPPIVLLTGTTALAPGREAYFWLDATAGNWALACFEIDAPGQAAHHAKGMVLDLAV